MSQNKHTLGPWELIVEPYCVRVENANNIVSEIYLPDGDDENDDIQRRLSIADARLIAAAPELLALLEEARRTLEMWKDVAPAVSLCADIDRLIAKARGEK